MTIIKKIAIHVIAITVIYGGGYATKTISDYCNTVKLPAWISEQSVNYDDRIRKYLDRATDRVERSIGGIERSEEQLAEIRTESERIAADNREAERINTETGIINNKISRGIERSENGVKTIQAGIDRLQNIINQQRKNEKLGNND